MKHWFAVLGAMLVGGLWVLLYGKQVGVGALNGKGVFLPERLGWTGALIFSITGLIAFYIFVTWLEARKIKESMGERA